MEIGRDDDGANRGFFIRHPKANNSHSSTDITMAQYFNIKYNEYIKLLEKWGAKKYVSEYYFETKEDTEKFLNSKDLEPHLILARLCND